MKNIKNIVIVIVVFAFIAFIIHAYYLDYRSKKDFIEKEFRGRIDEIKYFKNHRGLPSIIINKKIYYLPKNIDIQVGDSIVKKKGIEKIKVYRKDKKDEWDVKVFK